VKVRRKTLDVRRQTVDGRRTRESWRGRRSSVVGRANAVIPATSGRIYHQGSKAPREEPQGGQGGQGGKDIFTTKTQRARRKANRREDKKKAPRGFGPSVACESAGTEETKDTKKGANGSKGDW
jgi:hypothetical protein